MEFILLGPNLKIQRAYSHLISLECAEREFFELQPSSLIIENDPETGKNVAKIRLNEPAPAIIHVLAGELIYQLRSSLDQIAVALARMSAAKPNVRNVYFPTGDSLVGFQKACEKSLVGFDADFIDQIKSMEAYDGGDDILRAVFRMANIDKHIELIPLAAEGNIAILSDFTFRRASFQFKPGMHSLQEGIVISEFGPDGSITPNNSEAKIQVAGYIALGETSIYNGKPLLSFLRQLTNKTRDVYNTLVAHCLHTGRF